MLHSLCALLMAGKIPYVCDAPMSQWTTIRVGGPADCLVEARTPRDVSAVLNATHKANVPVLVIGNGSNLLVRDGGIRGVVLVIGGKMASIVRHGDGLLVEAGASIGAVARAAMAECLSGLEEISGIPGAIGGATAMNAGAYEKEIGGLVSWVDAVDREGKTHHLGHEDLDFQYRHSTILDKSLVVTRVFLALNPGNAEVIGAAMRDFSVRRRQKQPLTLPSAGSFFKRPLGHFAGELIEKAGLKGVSVGGAQVSTLHAGFLVNTGGAVAEDFIDLMTLIQARVFDMFGVVLEPEVQIVGCNSY